MHRLKESTFKWSATLLLGGWLQGVVVWTVGYYVCLFVLTLVNPELIFLDAKNQPTVAGQGIKASNRSRVLTSFKGTGIISLDL